MLDRGEGKNDNVEPCVTIELYEREDTGGHGAQGPSQTTLPSPAADSATDESQSPLGPGLSIHDYQHRTRSNGGGSEVNTQCPTPKFNAVAKYPANPLAVILSLSNCIMHRHLRPVTSCPYRTQHGVQRACSHRSFTTRPTSPGLQQRHGEKKTRHAASNGSLVNLTMCNTGGHILG